LVPYRGQCLVHRAQIKMLQGAWSDALDETLSACEVLRDPFIADAYYLLGELHRLRGEFDAAEAAFRRANSGGRRPEPGLVRLRVAQGRLDDAATTIRRLRTEEHDGPVHAEVLAACVDVMVETGDLTVARDACEELTALEAATGSPLLGALAARATGTVLMAAGQPGEALQVLRRGWRIWQDLDLPYDAALTRVLSGRCLRALGDEDSAQMELDSARWVFDRLGAGPDLAVVDALAGTPTPVAGGLTRRELDVIKLVASGLTNRAVANELFLSEKTVARHLSNIYAKLDLPSRAAATAYAYDHGLV
jgi:ATP/maltotriose-dependent transcriptional regulator MalT